MNVTLTIGTAPNDIKSGDHKDDVYRKTVFPDYINDNTEEDSFTHYMDVLNMLGLHTCPIDTLPKG